MKRGALLQGFLQSIPLKMSYWNNMPSWVVFFPALADTSNKQKRFLHMCCAYADGIAEALGEAYVYTQTM